MNTQKPARVVTCRGCTQEFERSQKNQRYCPTCRDARAAAMEALRVKVCNRCGMERDDCKHGICPDCREIADARSNANYEARIARKLARINERGGCPCGKPATCPWSAMCDECDAKRQQEARRVRHERQRQEAQKPRQDATPQQDAQSGDWKSDFMDWYDGLSDAQQRIVYAALRGATSILPGNLPTDEEVNPEEIPAPNQDRIDDAFRDLMEGFDL